jgi:hypothetical protein
MGTATGACLLRECRKRPWRYRITNPHKLAKANLTEIFPHFSQQLSRIHQDGTAFAAPLEK